MFFDECFPSDTAQTAATTRVIELMHKHSPKAVKPLKPFGIWLKKLWLLDKEDKLDDDDQDVQGFSKASSLLSRYNELAELFQFPKTPRGNTMPLPSFTTMTQINPQIFVDP